MFQLHSVIMIEDNILNISLDEALFELDDYRVFKKRDKWLLKCKFPDSNIGLQFKTEVIHSKNKQVGIKFLHTYLRSLIEGSHSSPLIIGKEMEFLY